MRTRATSNGVPNTYNRQAKYIMTCSKIKNELNILLFGMHIFMMPIIYVPIHTAKAPDTAPDRVFKPNEIGLPLFLAINISENLRCSPILAVPYTAT